MTMVKNETHFKCIGARNYAEKTDNAVWLENHWWILQNISTHYSGNVVITLYRKHRGSLKLRNYKFLLTGITGSPFSCKVMVKECESFQLARKWHYMYIVQFKTVINK